MHQRYGQYNMYNIYKHLMKQFTKSLKLKWHFCHLIIFLYFCWVTSCTNTKDHMATLPAFSDGGRHPVPLHALLQTLAAIISYLTLLVNALRGWPSFPWNKSGSFICKKSIIWGKITFWSSKGSQTSHIITSPVTPLFMWYQNIFKNTSWQWYVYEH